MFLLKAVQLSVCWACNEARLPKTMIDTGKLVRSQFQLLGFRLLKALGHWGPPTPITYVKQYKIFAINHFMCVPSCCTIVTIDFECIYFLPWVTSFVYRILGGVLQIFPWPQQVSQLVRHFQLDLTQRSSLVRTRLSSSSQNEQKKVMTADLGQLKLVEFAWDMLLSWSFVKIVGLFFHTLVSWFYPWFIHTSFLFFDGICAMRTTLFFNHKLPFHLSLAWGAKSPDEFTCCQALAPLGVQRVLVVSFTALPSPVRIWGNAFVRRGDVGMLGCGWGVLFFSGLKISGFKIQA